MTDSLVSTATAALAERTGEWIMEPVPDDVPGITLTACAFVVMDSLRVGAFERVMDALKAAAMAGGGEVAMSPAEVAVLAVDAVLGPDE